MSVIAVDFDGVIMDPHNRKPGRRMGEPVEGAIEAVNHLKRQGHTIIIHTVRGNRPDHIADWLRYFKIPYDQITDIKPEADCYLDDKCVRFTSWHMLGPDPEWWAVSL